MFVYRSHYTAAVIALCLLLGAAGCTQVSERNPSTRGQFLQFSVGEPENRRHALEWIDDHWQPGFESMAIEALKFASDRHSRERMADLLQRKTGQSFGADTAAWQRWLWRSGPPPHPDYAQIKATYFGMVDPGYRLYFKDSPATQIRLDEVQWVGLKRSDDLPALREPAMVAAPDSPLAGDQLVYGIQLQGHARAYARGLVSQHGVVTDSVGNRHFMLVDDSLTGSAAAYLLDDQIFAVSGFLHRGDPLLYDRATQSLWSSLRGRPVVGALVKSHIQLASLPAIAVRWSDWQRWHPDSQVTADNPEQQAYFSGQANYRKFAAKDRVVPASSPGDLAAGTRVVGLSRHGQALAVPVARLTEHPIFNARLGPEAIVLITGTGGATRAYLPADVEFRQWADRDHIEDTHGAVWHVTEEALINTEHRKLPRLALRRARWAAWAGAYADTQVAH